MKKLFILNFLLFFSVSSMAEESKKLCKEGKGLLPGKTCYCGDEFIHTGKKLTCSGDNFCNKDLVANLCNTTKEDVQRHAVSKHSHVSIQTLGGTAATDSWDDSRGIASVKKTTHVKRNYNYVASSNIATCQDGASLSPGQSCVCGSEYQYHGKKLTCAGDATCGFNVVNTVCGTHHSQRTNIKDQGFYVLHRTNTGSVKYRTKYAPYVSKKKTIKKTIKTDRQVAEESLDTELFDEGDFTEEFNEEFNENDFSTRDIASEKESTSKTMTKKTTIIKKTTRSVVDDEIDLDELIEDDWE